MNYDLIILGAGAAGLAAAVTFSRKCDGRVLIIDANDEPGRKLLATGNGRCNITNTRAPGYDVTKEFFESLGIVLAVETEGRVYPLGRQAKVVRDALVRGASEGGAEFLQGTTVTGMRRGEDNDFVITAQDKEFRTTQAIVATGGKAGPQYGSTGDGFAFARSLGVSVDMILPSLTVLKYGDDVLKNMAALKGVRVKANALLVINGENIAESSGEVQFTDKALSGICIFDLSAGYNRYKIEEGVIREAVVLLDLAPDMKESDLADLLSRGGAAGLSGVVNDKLAGYIGAVVSGDLERNAKQSCAAGSGVARNADAGSEADELVRIGEQVRGAARAEVGGFERDVYTEAERKTDDAARIADLIKSFEVPVSSAGGWKEAQTTAGGVSSSELDEKHFESRKVPGLYFAGEVLSSNLPCGGYNLDFAWNTGITTGARAAGYYNFSRRQDFGDQATGNQ